MKVALIYGSTRKERQGIKGARFVKNMLEKRGHEVSFIDAMEHPHPLLDKTYKEYAEDEAPKTMREVAGMLENADGVVVAASEYNHSIPGPLKNLIDHYMQEYFWKPSAIVGISAGSFGGMRAAMTLRAVLPEVGMPTIPSLFPITHVQDSFDDDGNAKDPAYEKRVKKFLDELEWYMRAFKAEREKGTPY
ncbi:MAG: NADPH-dependent FMN reductase [Candidatus Woesearchaeota archaeon]